MPKADGQTEKVHICVKCGYRGDLYPTGDCMWCEVLAHAETRIFELRQQLSEAEARIRRLMGGATYLSPPQSPLDEEIPF